MRWSLLLLGVLLNVGCALFGPAPTPVEQDWAARSQRLGELADWQVRGRISFKDGEQAFNGSFDWRQLAGQADIHFRGPLGVGGFQLTGDNRRMTVRTSDGEVRVLEDPERDLSYQFGWSLPLGSMRYWVMGIPVPGAGSEETYDEFGRLASLQQGDWTISYPSYRESAGEVMPRKMRIEGRQLRVRLAVDRWTLGDPGEAPER